jgi:hypothetical protein
LVEIEIDVRTECWAGPARWYLDPAALTTDAMRPRHWHRIGHCETLWTDFTSLRFLTIDAWGHVACRVSIQDRSHYHLGATLADVEPSLLSVTLATALASIDRFGQGLSRLGEHLEREARLWVSG